MGEYDETASNDANLLAGDSIVNYRTVASFGYDNLIVEEYRKLLEIPKRGAVKRSHCIGLL